jgi:CBS-domain-containing membrane protein
MNELYEDSQKDERVLAAYREWSECMAEPGYDFTSPNEASRSIHDLVEAIPYNEATGEQDPAALAEIRDDEIATATADRTCQDSTGAEAKALKAEFAVEQDFIDAHKAELDAMLEKASQADGK